MYIVKVILNLVKIEFKVHHLIDTHNAYYKNMFQVVVNSLWAQTHENMPQTTVNTCVGHK